MPFYEYECAACGRYHEAMQKMSDAPLKACPACGKSRLVRLISAPQFRLKGAGWYETDFKGTADAKRNLADSAEPVAKADDAKEDKARVNSVYEGMAFVLTRDGGKRISTTEQWADLQANTLQLAIEQPGKYPGLDVAIENVFVAKVGTKDVLPSNADTRAKLIDACKTIASSAAAK